MLVVDSLALLGLYLADYDCGINGFYLVIEAMLEPFAFCFACFDCD